jgi:hypothetical protein
VTEELRFVFKLKGLDSSKVFSIAVIRDVDLTLAPNFHSASGIQVTPSAKVTRWATLCEPWNFRAHTSTYGKVIEAQTVFL